MKRVAWNEDLAQELADLTYYGLSIGDCCKSLGLDGPMSVLWEARYLKVIEFAKSQAKLDLLKKCMEVALDVDNRECIKASQFLLSSRFGIVPNAKELKQQNKHHKENLEQKRIALENMMDLQASKLIAMANSSQLTEWTRDDVQL